MATMPWNDAFARGGIAVLALAAIALTAGCAVNSEMTNQWQDPTLAPGTVRNVLVVAARKDPVRRRAWEDAFVSGLGRRGIAATPSYRAFPGGTPDTADVIAAVRKNGYDAVLTSVRLPNEETSRWVPGAVRPEEVNSWDYYGRFHTRWVTLQDAGYTETDTVIQVETDLWDTSKRPGHLVWSATLRTLESVTGRSAEKAVAHDILPLMQKQGVVPAESK